LAFHSGREANHAPLSSAEVGEWVELYFHSPTAPSWRGDQGEHRYNFIPFTGATLSLQLHAIVLLKSRASPSQFLYYQMKTANGGQITRSLSEFELVTPAT
jgi:hypothetical protein